MPMLRPGRVLAVAAVLLVGGCNWWYNDVPSPDDLMHRIPWFDHMLGSKAIYPYQRGDIPRTPVPGTIPVGRLEGDWGGEFAVGNTTTADALANPLAPDEGLERGGELFHTFCSPCHGPGGAGDGLVGRRMGAPSLMTQRAQDFSDGYLYSIIRYGRGIMGQYGDKIHRIEDRWRVVNYLRQLQAGGGN